MHAWYATHSRHAGILLVWGFALSAALVAADLPAAPIGYTLSWSDEFDGTSLDTTKWGYRSLGVRRDAVNVQNAVSVGGGSLTITTYTDNGKHYTGMIATQGKFEATYGYWEARIAFHERPGMWSAFWIQSPTMGNPIGDPGTAGMEIDVVEHRAVTSGGVDVSNKAAHNLHWDGYGADHKSKGTVTGNLGLATGWHTYAVEWTPMTYSFFVDDRLTYSANPVSNRTEYILLSSEVEDDSWAGDIPTGGYGSLATSTTKMDVDYVRYYASSVPEPATLGLLALGGLVVVFARRWALCGPAAHSPFGLPRK